MELQTITSCPGRPARPAGRSRSRACRLLSGAVLLASGPASAHVKWFSPDANCATPPLSLHEAVWSQPFMINAAIAAVVMLLACQIDVRLSRARRVEDWSLRADARVAPIAPMLLRLGLAAFFVVGPLYFREAPVYLTPELLARESWVPWLQLAIAASLLHRSSAWLGASGMLVLYGLAAREHGWFHLLDYPIFIGAAVSVAIDSLSKGQATATVLGLLRFTAGVTLMWASAEKWLYPWWSYGSLDNELSALRGGMSNPFVMAAAGWVEFCCAYALVFGRAGVQVAAWCLLPPFLLAIVPFGPVDAIGHAPIILVLVILGLTRSRLPAAWQGADSASAAWRRTASCLLAGLATTGLYAGLQAIAHPRPDLLPSNNLVAWLLVAAALLWLLVRAATRAYLRADLAPKADPVPG